MKKTLFRKYLKITSLIILVSFLCLGSVMVVFVSRYWNMERRELLLQNAHGVSNIAATSLLKEDKNTFTIDGRLQQDFFDTDTVAMHKSNSIEYSLWRDVKPYCFSVIRGRRTPLNFRIVLQLSHKQTQQILNPSFPDGSVPDCRFCLNLQYRNDSLLCTTGVSYTSFCLDKRPEHLWDEIIRKFLSGQHIAFQVL